MPIHEYVCQKCYHIFEAPRSVSDIGDLRCPRCNSSKLERLMSGVGYTKDGGAAPTCPTTRGCT